MNKTYTSYTSDSLARFFANVNKLDMTVHTRTVHPTYGTVSIRKPASANNGKRLFSVSNTQFVHPGTYTMAGLKRAFATV